MAAALLRHWIVRGYLGEGRHLLAPLLAIAAATPAHRNTSARMVALYAAAAAALFQGDYTACGPLAEDWLALARDLEDERGIWLANDMLARVVINQGDYPRAQAIFVDQLAVMRRLRDHFGICSVLVGLGVLARLQGDYERAVACCEECLAVSREAGDHWFIGQALSNLGLARYQQGQYGVARKQFVEALALRRELGDQCGIAWSLINRGTSRRRRGTAPRPEPTSRRASRSEGPGRAIGPVPCARLPGAARLVATGLRGGARVLRGESGPPPRCRASVGHAGDARRC